VTEERADRRLAAILAADVVGYSRLMGRDEEGTLNLFNAHLAELIEPCLTEHKGRIVKTTGDGLLVEFASVVDAVHCAVSIQNGMKERNADTPENRRIEFRIGINVGDVIVQDNDVFGDGVNVAARLEGLATPGGICISRAARDQIRDKLDYGLKDLGEVEVKNIARPVRVFRILPDAEDAGKTVGRSTRSIARYRSVIVAMVSALIAVAVGVAWWQPWVTRFAPTSVEQMRFPLPNKPSIAVLPFANLNQDPKQEYFSDGITNDIITDLSKFASLYVSSSNTVFTYKAKPAKAQDVSRETGVRYVLEGSVQQSGKRVRINVQLSDAIAGIHLWAKRYDRELEGLFALQDEIVQTIVSTLAVRVSAAERERAMRKDTDSLEAYDYLLRGWEYFSRTTRSANLEARKMFLKAIELDPRYALAYVGLGWTYRASAGHGWTEFPDQALEKAHEFAQKALSLKESSAAHRLLGYVYLIWEKYDQASLEIRRAIELNPNDWDSRAIQGSIMLYTGRPDEALRALETASRFNPAMDPDRVFELGLAYYLKGQYDEAIKILEQNLARNPDHGISRIPLSAAFAKAGRSEDAAREVELVRRTDPFFDIASFGSRFRNPADRNSIADGLRKAGLK
jgi:TolB-like protein/class 3 adenylate cyclase